MEFDMSHVILKSLDLLKDTESALETLGFLLDDTHDEQLQRIGTLLGHVTSRLSDQLRIIENESCETA